MCSEMLERTCPFCLHTAEYALPVKKYEAKCHDCESILIIEKATQGESYGTVIPKGYELIREWSQRPFELKVYDMHKKDHLGKWRLAYEFYCGTKLIFKGNQFSCSPMHAVDSNEILGALLGFLSVKPGYTDTEYFEDYSKEQLEFAETYGEELSMYAIELEEKGA